MTAINDLAPFVAPAFGRGSARHAKRFGSATRPPAKGRGYNFARRRQQRRGTALFMAVTGTTMIVSVLGLSAMAIVRIERKQAAAFNTRQLARSNARSAVELGLKMLNDNDDWRDDYTSGTETAGQSLGSNGAGALSWSVSDTDDNLTNSDVQLRLKGIGRVGNTTQVSSIRLDAAGGSGGASVLLRNYELLLDLGSTVETLEPDKWWAQYFLPNLPPDAVGWNITSVQLRVRKKQNGHLYRVRLYKMADLSLIDSVELNSSGLDNVWQWITIPYSGAVQLAPDDGVLLAMETSASGTPLNLLYDASGVSEADSALVRGTPTWQSPETDKSLLYRAYGQYTTSDEVAPVAGTWLWDAP